MDFIDEHSIRIPASRERVWAALKSYTATSLGVGGPVAKILGTQPPAGFEVAASRPGEHLELVGRHRFSRYRLVFGLAEEGDGGTRLSASSYADFPGLRGRAYRALVIGSGGHVLFTRHVIRTIGSLATRNQPA
ncbi:hypothetical protein [Longispora albida]|uniref:hypothetical protein n=1 Tax=Longispora albida TaxID=203523 RepID=UPI00058C3C31|nr:hypothetical protein [Longispora albida]